MAHGDLCYTNIANNKMHVGRYELTAAIRLVSAFSHQGNIIAETPGPNLTLVLRVAKDG